MSVLRTAYVEVKPQLDKFGAELKAKLAKINADAEGKKLAETFQSGFGKSFNEKGNAFAKATAGVVTKLTLLTSAAAAATPGMVRLVQAIAPAAGVMVALPAGILSAQVALLTFKVATDGVSKAISSGLTGSAKQAQKAIEGLPPAAQTFARSIIALKPQIESLKTSVTQRFFLPMQDDIGRTAKIYFPLLRTSMANLAGPLGGLGEQILQTARKTEVFGGVKAIFASTRLSVINLRGAVDPLITAFANLITATAPKLPALAAGFSNIATKVGAFISQAAKSGQISAIFQNAITTIKQLGGILGNIGSILASVFRAANSSGVGLLGNLKALTGQIASFLKSAQGSAAIQGVFSALAALGQAMRTSLAAVLPAVARSLLELLPAVKGLAPAFAQIIVAIAPVLPALTKIVVELIEKLIPALNGLATWLSHNHGALTAFATAAGVAYAAIKVYEVYTKAAAIATTAWSVAAKVASAATKIWTGIQVAFNFVLSANPIGIVVVAIGALVAAVIVAYKNSATFRAIVQGAWNGIKTAVSAVVAWFKSYVFPVLKSVYDALATAAMWLWHNVIQPAWNGIKTVISVVVAGVKIYLAAMRAEFNIVATVVKWLYNTIFKPLFTAIGYAVKVAWVVIEIALAAMKLFFQNVIAPIVKWLYNNVFLPNWNAIKALVAAVVAAIKATLTAMKAFFENVIAPTIRWLYNNVVRPIFTSIGSFISATINNVVKPVFNALKTAFSAVGSALAAVWNNVVRPMFSAFGNFLKNTVAPLFSKGVEAIKAAWQKIQDAARVPVAFVVNHVINPLVSGINSAARFVGVKDQIPLIKGFASGGQIPGTPSLRDNMLAAGPGGAPIGVASGEFITNTKSTMANFGLVHAINQKRGPVGLGDILPHVQGFDAGGVVGAIGGFFKKVINGAKGVGSFILNPGAGLAKLASSALNTIPGGGSMIPFIKGAAMRVINGAKDWLTSKISPPQPPSGGQTWPWIVQMAQQLVPGIKPISTFRAGAVTLSGNRSYHAVGEAVDFPPNLALAKGWKSRFGSITNELITPWNNLNMWNGKPHTYTGAVWNQHNFAGGNAHDHIAVAGNLGGGLAGAVSRTVAGASLGAWITAAIRATGVPSSWASGLSTLIMRESGGNPNAVNRTDSNARAGHPSQGLAQVIPSTFAAYRVKSLPNNILNPVSNIAAAIRYILARYGSISNVQQANPNLPPKGYSAGGLVKALGLPFGSYDSGGFLPKGISLAHNGTGRPEPVGHGLGTSYSITVQVAPGGNPVETGRQVVEQIKAFERANGARWRKG